MVDRYPVRIDIDICVLLLAKTHTTITTSCSSNVHNLSFFLLATGANIRNCGDCIAQAAASCRFKTAAELVIDELREGEWEMLNCKLFSYLMIILNECMI